MITSSTHIIITEHARRRFIKRVPHARKGTTVNEIVVRVAKSVPIDEDRRQKIQNERHDMGLVSPMYRDGFSYYLMDDRTVLVFERVSRERLRLVTLWNVQDHDAD
jgi:hypothetical protein